MVELRGAGAFRSESQAHQASHGGLGNLDGSRRKVWSEYKIDAEIDSVEKPQPGAASAWFMEVARGNAPATVRTATAARPITDYFKMDFLLLLLLGSP